MSNVRTATPQTARAINDRIALELLTEHGPLTAARLRELTGLSRPSVAELLGRLGRGGLVDVVGETGAERRGPNARVYGLVAGRAHVAALDVRVEGVSLALADLAGSTVASRSVPLVAATGRREGQHPMVAAVLATLRAAGAEAGVAELHTVALGAPGLADPATGALRVSDALPAWHRELVTALRETVGAPVLLENEVNLAGIAEHRLGSVRDRDTFVLLWLGVGVGAAVVLDGALRRGASGGAGELGFLPVPGTGRLPSAVDCDGGLHSLVSGAAVRALAARHGLHGSGDEDAAGATAERLVAGAAARPDGSAGAFLDELAGRVALGAASATAVLDPGCVVLGGEVGRAGGRVLAARVGTRLRELSPLDTEVRATAVDGNPVLGGALVTALDAARAELFATDR
ncbi:Sugar kinase of the NBD/HSP70 family, may contain an N-terminal HTH domain [Streptomyces zhaozhouensis]|uniref:Sugar kinase of the NBD/HSP70 family, may contain an N-terminal HTH domain n=1 Tax=Streptomyces zhaozhouensis TaxID=1300267 RepID=A0A286DRE4_9ACTN|nr:ROK family protein [Streptomyces zhaozhouensis]SOD61201.1 Sugar kinase of the NBD/HSP70 family, may contain an N-terminal HTH domain [Streptomyces zhaozhouensis]